MRRVGGMGLLVGVIAAAGCFDASIADPNPGDDVRITYVGAAVSDSAEAVVEGVRFFVSEAGSEDHPLVGLRALFIPEGEACGEALTATARTDDEGLVETQWQLGDLAGRCVLRVRVVNASGLLLDVLDIEADVLHGQAALLDWIGEGDSVTGNGTLARTGDDDRAFDRLSNDVPWRFRVVSGPVQTVGSGFGTEGARTLVASGVPGAGQVAVESRWGDVVLLDLCVTAGTPAADIRLHWTPAGGTPPTCGA